LNPCEQRIPRLKTKYDMLIEKKETYAVILPEESSFSEFYTVFLSKTNEISETHLFLNLLDTFPLSVGDLERFSVFSERQKENGKSFVLITNAVEIDDFEDETLSVVPTLIEAEDVLEMDEIERDLMSS
jgi:hypothetical protein